MYPTYKLTDYAAYKLRILEKRHAGLRTSDFEQGEALTLSKQWVEEAFIQTARLGEETLSVSDIVRGKQRLKVSIPFEGSKLFFQLSPQDLSLSSLSRVESGIDKGHLFFYFANKKPKTFLADVEEILQDVRAIFAQTLIEAQIFNESLPARAHSLLEEARERLHADREIRSTQLDLERI